VIVDHFEIPERQEFLSLARLDYDAFKKNVENNKEFQKLPDKVREDIKERADKLHKEMEAEAERLSISRGYFNNSDEEDY
jgi:Fe-S cluster assembly scaffold protein SufB